MVKIDFKQELRELYLPGREPALVDVPEMGFLMIDGRGGPEDTGSYQEAIETLYSVAYTVKFDLKRRASDAAEFAVMPLESLWWSEGTSSLNPDAESEWNWTAMIMQPDLVTAEDVDEARAEVATRKPTLACGLLRYERFDEGPSAQVMHIGPYSAEGPTIRALHQFIAEQDRTPAGRHHEIYLGDPRRCAPERLRTVIRQPVSVL